MENGSYLGMLFIFSLTYDSLIIFLFEKKNSTWIKSILFHFTAEPLQSNNSSNYYLSGCKNAKVNAFATVGLYGFLLPSLDYSESWKAIVRNAINTENY